LLQGYLVIEVEQLSTAARYGEVFTVRFLRNGGDFSVEQATTSLEPDFGEVGGVGLLLAFVDLVHKHSAAFRSDGGKLRVFLTLSFLTGQAFAYLFLQGREVIESQASGEAFESDLEPQLLTDVVANE